MIKYHSKWFKQRYKVIAVRIEDYEKLNRIANEKNKTLVEVVHEMVDEAYKMMDLNVKASELEVFARSVLESKGVPESYVKCCLCGRKLKIKNLLEHIRKEHPGGES